jgi:hypothetical protein
VQKLHLWTPLQNLGKLYGLWSRSLFTSKKILFHPVQWVCGLFLASLEAAMNNRAVGSGFDLGTSAHALVVDLPESHQETLGASSDLPPEKPVLMFGLSEEQRSHLAFAAKCEAEELAECYEADQLEVQEAVVHLWEAYKVLNGGCYE